MFGLIFHSIAWMKKVEVAKLEALRPSHLTEDKHLEKISILEREKFSLAKQIRDAERAIEYKHKYGYLY